MPPVAEDRDHVGHGGNECDGSGVEPAGDSSGDVYDITTVCVATRHTEPTHVMSCVYQVDYVRHTV